MHPDFGSPGQIVAILNFTDLGVEFGNNLEVSLEVGGEDGLDDEETETVQFPFLQVDEPVVARVRQQEAPGGRRVVTLQHRPVIVQDRLQKQAAVNLPSAASFDTKNSSSSVSQL